ncbi:TRAF3-interacting protein 1 isoform X1 [Drosophila kikkawai]|uniref:TRAF3-interacting protein 1 n=1 Tax=Drosophila kikkawai TaxID=30033 RepID=A0A6P4I6J2_DROKI|nr:TRAF3-interacting protein 1 [Drosophila kikkawai]
MSDKDLDAIIQVTQQVVGKFIKKPPLTEKLLKKPPFRFLMDVFNNVSGSIKTPKSCLMAHQFIKQTGKFDGLYTSEEQEFENIASREDKIRFLQKMIDAVKLTTKQDLKVRTSKIVAGQEPELTNELLQAMASVAEKNLDWDSAVDQVVIAHSKTPIALPKPSKETKTSSKNPSPANGKEEESKRRKEKRTSPQEQKLRKTTTEPGSRSTPTDKEKDKTKAASKKAKIPGAEPKLSRQGSKQKSPSPVKLKSKGNKAQLSTESDNPSMSLSPPMPAKHPAAPETVPTVVPKESKAEPSQEAAAPPPPTLSPPTEAPESRKSSAQRRSSASSNRSRRSSGTQRQPEPSPTEIPSQPALPKAEANPPADSNNNTSGELKRELTMSRENSKESNQRPRTSLRPPSARPASARPGAPRRRNVEIVLQPNDQIKMSGINVKLETFGDLDDDGENLVIIEDANSHDIVEGNKAEDPSLEGPLDAQQGRLVQQILETQKELVHQNAEVVEPSPSSATVRQSSARQVNDLRDVIQSLTKAVNPLGKLLDFIPEDIDAMQLELTMWRDTYTQAAIELKRERSLTASATEPMKHQLQQIEASIVEYQELVDESRHKILQNNARILKMLMEQ